MTHVTLFDLPPVKFPTLSLDQLRHTVYGNGSVFSKDFDTWLNANYDIFFLAADSAWKHRCEGYIRYGIAGIWEDIRRHSLLAEKRSAFKLTNLFRADVARLILLAYPQQFPPGFFVLHDRDPALLGCFDTL